jgi:2-dehydropantoate 2-reductase
MSERILVVGAGATGGFFGARLAQHGRDVTFLVRPPRAAALSRDGLRVTGPDGTEVIDAHAVTAPDLGGGYDVVLLSVKATGLGQALDDLAPAAGPGTAIVPFLNGLTHMEVLNERFGPRRVLGAAVRVISTLDAGGTIVQLAPLASITIGAQDGTPPSRAQDVAGLLSGAGFTVQTTGDIIGAMWHKWVFIVSLGALTCLARGTVGEVAAVPGGTGLALAILDEAAAVAAAAGHPLPPAERDAAAGFLTKAGSAASASMYRDLQAGRRTEVEHVFGDLISRARSLGVATPLLDAATLTMRVHDARLGMPPG